MKPKFIAGILLIVLGVVALAYQGITYKTDEEAIDLSPLKITAEQSHTIPLPPILGVVALVGGILLLVVGGRKA